MIPKAGIWRQGLDDSWEGSLGQLLALELGLGTSSIELDQPCLEFLGKIFLYQAVVQEYEKMLRDTNFSQQSFPG